MSKFKVGDTVEIIANDRELRAYSCNSDVVKGGAFIILSNNGNYYQLKNIDNTRISRGWVMPHMIKLKSKSLRNHYSIQAKRNITREWLALPRGTGGRAKNGAVAALFHKYGVALKSTRHANSLLRGDTGWLQQYNNGGWDTSNAVAFKRTVEIKGVL